MKVLMAEKGGREREQKAKGDKLRGQTKKIKGQMEIGWLWTREGSQVRARGTEWLKGFSAKRQDDTAREDQGSYRSSSSCHLWPKSNRDASES